MRGPEDGPPALVIPGFLATDRTCMELRRSLARRGWRTYPWDLGLNKGAHADVLRHLRQRLETIYDGRPVLLVGWSLGGLFARELAREVPDMVRAVVTLGSPFSGDPHQNNVWHIYEWVQDIQSTRRPCRISLTNRQYRRWRSGRGGRYRSPTCCSRP